MLPEQKKETNIYANVISSLLSTLIGTALLHPVERTIFLATKFDRPVLHPDNFIQPYYAFKMSLIQRSFLGSSAYFFIRDEIKRVLTPFLQNDLQLDQLTQKAVLGLASGSLYGFFTSVALLIKANWKTAGFGCSVVNMYQKGGLRIFARGMPATIGRDAIIGLTYESTRHRLRETEIFPFNYHFMCDATGAMFATIFSTLHNYIRVKQIGTSPEQPAPTFSQVANTLWQDAKAHHPHLPQRLYFATNRMKVVFAVGKFSILMPIYQELYQKTQALFVEIFGAEALDTATKDMRPSKPASP